MSNRFKRWNIIVLVFIVALGFVFRFYQLEILPAWASDEGRWALGPAMGAVHGDWSKGGLRFSFDSPTWTRLLYLDFLLLGPSVMHARIASALLGVLCIPLVYVICRRCGYSHRAGLLGALFLALESSVSVVNRQALSDSATTAGVMTAFALFIGSPRQRALSPIALAAAICAKPTAIFGVAVMYLCRVSDLSELDCGRLSRYVKAALLPLVALCLASAWYLWLYLGHPHEFANAWMSEIVLRQAQGGMIFNPFLELGLFDAVKYYVLRMPFLLATGVAGIVMMLRQKPRPYGLPLWWLLFGVAVVALQNHQPHRYYTPAIPALCICAGWAVAKLLENDTNAFRSALWARRVGVLATAMILIYGIGIWWAYYFVAKGHTETDGPEVVRWVNRNIPKDARVMGISLYGLGTNVDYYAQEVYSPRWELSRALVRKLNIDYVIFDKKQWGSWVAKKHLEVNKELKRDFRMVAKIGDVAIWERSTQTKITH